MSCELCLAGTVWVCQGYWEGDDSPGQLMPLPSPIPPDPSLTQAVATPLTRLLRPSTGSHPWFLSQPHSPFPESPPLPLSLSHHHLLPRPLLEPLTGLPDDTLYLPPQAWPSHYASKWWCNERQFHSITPFRKLPSTIRINLNHLTVA